MRTRTLLLWSAAATAVLVGLVAVLLTLPVDPAKAHHIPEDIDLTEAPHNLSLIGQKGTHGFWGTPTTEDNRYVDKSIGPYQEDKKTMRQCGCALAALATVARYMLPRTSGRLWSVLWDPLPTDPNLSTLHTRFDPGYLDDYFRFGRVDSSGRRVGFENWGYLTQHTKGLCGVQPTELAQASLFKPELVCDGSGNCFESGITGLAFGTELMGEGGLDAETKDLILKYLQGHTNWGVPTPVIASYDVRWGPHGGENGEAPYSDAGSHAVVIVGYDAVGKRFLVVDPAESSGAGSEIPWQPVPWLQNGYAKWESDISRVRFPRPESVAPRYYEIPDDPAPIDMLAISPDGSRTGTDGTTGVEYDEDPDVTSDMFLEEFDFTGESAASPAAPSKNLSVRGPSEGTYRIQTVGTAAGQLVLEFNDVKSSSSAIDKNTALSIDRPIAAGEVQKFEMSRSGNNPATAEAVSSFSPEARAGNDTNGLTGVGVPFNGGGSFDYDGTISEYAWEFGDGTSATGADPSHAYSQPGTYTAKLTITDDAGRTATDTLTVTIELSQQKPVARLTGPYLATATRDVFLSSTESFDRNNDPLTYKWDFGDGTSATTGSESGVHHVYAEPRDYEVTLIVNDGKEDSLPAKSSVKVFANPETVGLSVPECVTPGSAVPVSLDNLFVQSSSWDIGYNGPVPEPPTVAEAQEQIDRTGPFGGAYGRAEGFGSTLRVESVEALSELTYTLNMTWQVPQDYAPGEHSVGFYNEGSDAFWNSSTSPCPVPENSPPFAHAGGPRYEASAGRPVTLDGSRSSDPDGDPLTYQWDLGDGSSASIVKPTHTYSNPGQYFVRLDIDDGTQTSPLGTNSFAVVDVGDGPPAPACTIGEIEPPVNDISSADDPVMSAYKFGSRGVIPAKFKAACDGDPIDTQAEADAHPMKLTLTKLGSTPDQDAVVENTETGSANTGDMFRFDDAADHYIYNVGVKNLASGTYKLTISEANGGATHDEWFSIK